MRGTHQTEALRLGRYEHPRVPVEEAIDHLDSARAVRNPGITPAAMHLMPDLAGVPAAR